MASLPYNPTLALTSAAFSDLVYILQDDSSSSQVLLHAVNISSSITASDLQAINLDVKTPFDTSNGTSITAFAGTQGEIFAVVGKCDEKLAGASIWIFQPANDGIGGEWIEAEIMLQQGQTLTGAQGALHLAGGITFSSIMNGTEDLFYFGGMCPDSTDETVATWQSSASYSDSLLFLEPSNDVGSSYYNAEVIAASGPPVAEAGFTITPLSPTYFNSSTGNVSMQQNFVLLGGHTQTAFINMSQVAILSLPEQTWSFVPVVNPASNSVEPRSGHTAVLSEDGQSVVVLGGWVGDINTPADPQLAVVQIGEGYGGTGQWQWTAPTAAGNGPGAGGIYGHGAVMLPGNVMMVTGGFTMGSNPGKLAHRASANSQNSYLFNVSSNSWINSYTNPGPSASTGSSASSTSSDSTKTGLGAGLGVGLSLLFLAVVAFLCWRRRRRRRRERSVRDEDLRGLSLGTNRLQSPILGFGGIDGRGGDRAAGGYIDHPHTRDADAYPWAPTLTESSLPGQLRRDGADRTGLLVEIPSPTRGLRRSLHSRGHHFYEDGRRSRGSSHIHPIDELDEYEPEEAEARVGGERVGLAAAGGSSAEMTQLNSAPLLARPVSDPFIDPPEQRSLLDGSRSPSPQSLLRERDIDMLDAGAVPVIKAHVAPLQPDNGRLSPNSKSDRTSSSISEASARSMVSALSQQPSVTGSGFVSRTISQRSAALFSSRPMSSSGPTTASPPTTEPGAFSPSQQFGLPALSPLHRIKRRPVSMPRARPALAPAAPIGSPNAPTFQQLQAEGPALLYGVSGSPPTADRRPTSSYAAPADDDEDDFDAEPLPNRKQPRPRSWMGSMRRALTGGSNISSPSGSGRPGSGRPSSTIGGSWAGAVLHRSSTPSPTSRSHTSSPGKEGPRFPLTGSGEPMESEYVPPSRGGQPQRSASVSGASLWAARRQQGSRDWDVPGSAAAGSTAFGSEAAGSAAVEGSGAMVAGRHRRTGSAVESTGGMMEWSSSSSDRASMNPSHGEEDEGDWDVESAVERRVVQLMFTVPREKLRVVNAADGEGVSLRSPGGSARSVRSLRKVFEGADDDEDDDGNERVEGAEAGDGDDALEARRERAGKGKEVLRD